jgi:hypothetical protein
MKLHVRSLLFRSPRSKLLAAGASFAAIALFTLILPATVASGASVSTSTLKDAGVLRLQLGATDRFRYEPTPNSPTNAVNQTVSASSCRLNLSPAGSLVTFSPPANAANNVSPYAGFFDESIGVGSRSEGNGQPCGKIDPGQTLTVNLASGLAGKVIDYAELDLELKFGGAVTVTGKLVQQDGTKTMATETYGSTGSDSGPDSGDGDNYRVRFPETGKTAINQLVFSVGLTGTGSLEGGADGTGACDAGDGCVEPSLGQSLAGTTDTLFHLVEADGVLDCDATAPEQGGNGTPLNSLERLANATGPPEDCVPIPFNLESAITNCGVDFLQCVLLQKDLLEQDAQFYWTVTWAPEPGEYQENETKFDFGNGPQDLQLCLADAAGDGFPDLPPTALETDPLDAVDPWCVVETSTVLQFDPVEGETFVVVKEKYFGSGDPLGKRG